MTAKPLREYSVWFVAGSQHLYGGEAIVEVDAHARAIAAALDAAEPMPTRVVHRPVVTTPQAIRRVCLEANADDECAGVIVWMHTFSPAKMWIAGLTALRKPLLHLHTQFNRALPWASIDMDFMNLNQSAHGDREHGFIQTRMGLRRKTVVGHWQDAAVVERVAGWTRAACGWCEAERLTVARFGDNMRQVAVTEGDKVEAQIRLGITVSGYGVGDLADAVAEASEESVARLVEDYDESYDLAPQLRADGSRRPALVEAARIEAGLRALLEEGGFGAFTDTFEDLHGLSQLPGIAVQRLMRDGYGFGAEGDWKAAALVRIVKLMARGLPGGTSFMEDYTYDFAGAEPVVLGAHMLEVCPSIAVGRPTAEIHPLSIGARADPVRLVFSAAPGAALLVSLVDLGDRFRLVANEIELIEPPEPLPRLPVARAVWRPKPDLAGAAEAWLEAGGSHHTVLTTSLGREPLEDFAEIAGIELVVIDAETRPRALRETLRWNQAYYRLAQRL